MTYRVQEAAAHAQLAAQKALGVAVAQQKILEQKDAQVKKLERLLAARKEK